MRFSVFIFKRLLSVNNNPRSINTIPGEALTSREVNPETFIIHSIEPVNPSTVRIIPAIKHHIPPNMIINS